VQITVISLHSNLICHRVDLEIVCLLQLKGIFFSAFRLFFLDQSFFKKNI